MAMISGPFTDAVVEMLRRSDRPGGMTGLWKNGAGVYGLSDGALFWHGGGIVSAAADGISAALKVIEKQQLL